MRTKPKLDPENSIGIPDSNDKHPLIVHAPHVHGGQAIFRDIPNLAVARVLRAVAAENLPVMLGSLNQKLRPAHLAASLLYAADVIEGVSKLQHRWVEELQGELGRRKRRGN